jgi:hypothetical protein
MKRRRSMSFLSAALLASLVASCGGATQEPSGPSSEPPQVTASAPREPAEPAAEAPATPSDAEAESAEAATPPAAEPSREQESGPGQAPSAILGTPSGAFIIDYNASAPKAAAEKTCAAEAEDDATKKHECLQKARAAFVADVLRFKKSAQGKWTWTVYQRKGASLPEVYKGDIELTDESKTTIKIKIKGTQSGKLPLFTRTKQGVITFPNDYSITLDDPQHGRLVYDAKVGLVGD